MKKQKGSLTIEASLVLTTFMFFILVFISFGRIYQAQNEMAHATFQTAKALAVESFARETFSKTTTSKLLDVLATLYSGESTSALYNNNLSLTNSSVNLGSVVKETFEGVLTGNETGKDVEDIYKSLGVKDISFSETKIDSSGILYLNVKYTIRFQFAFYSIKELKLNKIAKIKMFAHDGEKTNQVN